MKPSVYLTAAIPYVNGAPHLGHALEFLQADVLARFFRQTGHPTQLLTGADENSLKNVQAAEKEGITVQKLCDKNSKKFQDLIKNLNASFDLFQRSSSENHFKGSQLLWNLCVKNGDIYKKTYSGLYCVGCETFYTRNELTPDGLCPEHLTKPVEVSEENYFFRLSKYQKKLEELITSDKLNVLPPERKNEVLGFIRLGLDDFSISRSAKRAKGWGVPVPNDKNQIMYVWFDALNVYQTGIGFGWNEKEYNKWWPPFAHIIGKGIIRFHAVYWPAILLSAKLALPERILTHGYISIEKQKMSKSLGNVIDPGALIDKYGVDAVRYYLLREIPTTSDGDFSESRFKELYNADLANNLGNLVSRVARLCEQSKLTFAPSSKLTTINKLINSDIHNFQIHLGLSKIWDVITLTNKTIDLDKPWDLLKNHSQKLHERLNDYVVSLRRISNDLYPFLPDTSEKISTLFSGSKISSSDSLFPRIM